MNTFPIIGSARALNSVSAPSLLGTAAPPIAVAALPRLRVRHQFRRFESSLSRPDCSLADARHMAPPFPRSAVRSLRDLHLRDRRNGAQLLDWDIARDRRQARLAAELDKMLEEGLGRRVLPFDQAVARSFATIGAARKAAGMPISHADCQIAAIARSRGARVATRNDGDFAHCGVELINPWPA